MSVSENTLNQSAADGQSIYPMALESIENPGYMISYHPKPDNYSAPEWFHMVKCLHTSQGHIVRHVLAAVEYYDDGPYPLKSRVKTWGVEATWTTK